MSWVGKLKYALRPEYRIVQEGKGTYSAETWRLWWPFWRYVHYTSGMTAEHTQARLEDVLRLKRSPVIKYLGKI
jgi:hypothetical protein